jgi:Zn-dependent protease
VLLSAGVSEPFVIEMCKAGIRINAAMFAFNLFPLPPLDGGRIVFGLLPPKLAWQFAKIEPWGFYIVMALIVLNLISSLWMTPIMDLTFDLLNLLLTPVQFLLPS